MSKCLLKICFWKCEPFDMKRAKLECPLSVHPQPSGSKFIYIWFHLAFLFVIQWMAHGRPGAHGERVPYLAVLEPNSVIARAKVRRMEVPLVRPQARKPRSVMLASAQVWSPPLWIYYQLHKIVGCVCTGNAGNVFLATDFKGNRWLAIPACITARASRTCRDACRDR